MTLHNTVIFIFTGQFLQTYVKLIENSLISRIITVGVASTLIIYILFKYVSMTRLIKKLYEI